jgi:hypothetical protein
MVGNNLEMMYQAAGDVNSQDQGDWLQGVTAEVAMVAADISQPLRAGWARSVLSRQKRDLQFRDFLNRFHHVNPSATPPEVQRRLLSAEQAQFLGAQQDDRWLLPPFPSEEYSDPQLWQKGYRWIRNTPPYANRYFDDLIRRDLTTAVSQRTVLVRFVRRTLAHLLPDEPVRASCGCGDMSGDRRDWLSDHDEQFRFDPVQVLDRQGHGPTTTSTYKSDIFNDIVSEPHSTKRVVGFDRVDPDVPANKAWCVACATPDENLNRNWTELHDRIMRAHVPGSWLGFRLTDLSSKHAVQQAAQAVGQADVASEILCWYEGSAAARRRKFANMFQLLLKPDGLGISAEFARRVSSNTYLMPNPKWSELNVFVWHKGDLHRVLAFTNGRCHKVRVLSELGELARGGPHQQEVAALLA